MLVSVTKPAALITKLVVVQALNVHTQSSPHARRNCRKPTDTMKGRNAFLLGFRQEQMPTLSLSVKRLSRQ